MRARTLRPKFDRLDARLVMDSGADLIAGAYLGAAVLPLCDASYGIPDVDYATTSLTLADPSEIQIPWNYLNK